MTDDVYPEGFDVAAHDRWVSDGHCPALDYKTYCSGMKNHRGDHWAPYLRPDGHQGYRYWPQVSRGERQRD